MQNSKRAVRSTGSLLTMMLVLITLSVVRTNAQTECLGRCEERLATCVAQRGGQQFNADCFDTYEACVNSCLDTIAALLNDRPLTANHKPLAEIGGPADEQPV